MPLTAVRLSLDPDRTEDLWLSLAAFDTNGVDEGNLPSGEVEYLMYFPSPEQAAKCAAALASFGAEVIEVPTDQNWNQAWQSQWQARCIGQRFWIAPPGDNVVAPEGLFRLEYHTGTSFGNGDHPTTQMCIELLEESVRPGDTVVDLGCGSGLLLEAANALGARAIGCDIDPQAVVQAHRRDLDAFVGSIDAIRQADIVVANLSPGILVDLEAEIHRVARRVFIMSGAMADQRDLFVNCHRIREREGWLAGVARPRDSALPLTSS